MAKRFCSKLGSNTSPYDTWAKAATTFATAIGTGTVTGDIIAVDATNPPDEIVGSISWSFNSTAFVVASTNSGISTITPTQMGEAAWIGAQGGISLTTSAGSNGRVYFYGLTFRCIGTSNFSITVAKNFRNHHEFEECLFWVDTPGAASNIGAGTAAAGFNSYALFKTCFFKFAASTSSFAFRGNVDVLGGSILSSGAAPTLLLKSESNMTGVRFDGTDLSHVTGTLVASMASSPVPVHFVLCKFGAGVTVMATQASANKSGARVSVFDCSSGDVHGLFGYYDALGSVTSDTGVYLTDGTAVQSWKLVTTANCSFGTPFVTPWISRYNTETSAITPNIEILRNGSTTAYTDAQVWGEFSVKDNSGFTHSDTFSDRQALFDWVGGTAGVAQAAGVGAESWTGGTTPWSGKVDSGSAITPAESGHIRARVAVGAPSITVYVDPQIRT